MIGRKQQLIDYSCTVIRLEVGPLTSHAGSSPHVTWRECQSQDERTPSVGTTRPEKCKSIQRCVRGVSKVTIYGPDYDPALKTRNQRKNKVFPAPSRRPRFLVHVLKVATRRKAVKRNRCFGTNFLPRLSRGPSFRCNETGVAKGAGDRDSAPQRGGM